MKSIYFIQILLFEICDKDNLLQLISLFKINPNEKNIFCSSNKRVG